MFASHNGAKYFLSTTEILIIIHILKNIMATSGLGIPVKLLHESLGHIITVELKTGQLYRGKLAEGDC